MVFGALVRRGKDFARDRGRETCCPMGPWAARSHGNAVSGLIIVLGPKKVSRKALILLASSSDGFALESTTPSLSLLPLSSAAASASPPALRRRAAFSFFAAGVRPEEADGQEGMPKDAFPGPSSVSTIRWRKQTPSRQHSIRSDGKIVLSEGEGFFAAGGAARSVRGSFDFCTARSPPSSVIQPLPHSDDRPCCTRSASASDASVVSSPSPKPTANAVPPSSVPTAPP